LDNRNKSGKNLSLEIIKFFDSRNQIVCVAERVLFVVVKLRNGWRKSDRVNIHQQLPFANQGLMLKQLGLHLIEAFILRLGVVRQDFAFDHTEQNEPLGR